MKICFALLLSLCSVLVIRAQNSIKIKVSDSGSGLTLPYANIRLNSYFLSTDSMGIVEIEKSMLKKNNTLKVSYIGYEDFTKEFIEFDFSIIQLVPSNQLAEVEIFGNRINYQNGANILNLSKIQYTPSLFSSNDLVRQLQIIPGMKAGVEGTTDLLVRGGNSGQSIFLIDGLEVETNSHLLGMLSPISSSIVNKVSVYKSGFPARFNNRLSGFIDIKTKTPAESNSLEIGVSSLSIDLLKKVRFKEDFFLNVLVRKSTIDGLINLYHLKNEKKILNNNGFSFEKDNSGFGDVYLKVIKGDENKFSYGIQYLGSYDFVTDQYKILENRIVSKTLDQNKWSNQSGQIFLNSKGSKISSRNSFQLKRNVYHIDQYDNASDVDGGMKIFEATKEYIANSLGWLLKTENTFNLSKEVYVDIGSSYRQRETNLIYQIVDKNNRIENDSIFKGGTINLYTSLNMDFDRTGFRLGLNAMRNSLKGPINLEPRVMLLYKFGSNLSQKVFFSGSRMVQTENLISDRPIGKYLKLFIPSSEKIKPVIGNEFSIGYSLNSSLVSLSFESYFKTQNNLYFPKEGESQLLKPNQIGSLEYGTSKSFGLEAALDYKIGKDIIYVNYAFSKSNLLFPNINNGKSFENFFNRPQDFSAFYYFRSFGKGWRPNIGFTIKSGIPISLYTQYYRDLTFLDIGENSTSFIGSSGNVFVDSRYAFLLPELHNYRMPVYHRLDFNLIKEFRKAKRKSYLTIGIYNVYARKNPILIEHETKIKLQQTNQGNVPVFDGYKYNGKSYFVFVPSINYTILFN